MNSLRSGPKRCVVIFDLAVAVCMTGMGVGALRQPAIATLCKFVS